MCLCGGVDEPLGGGRCGCGVDKVMRLNLRLNFKLESPAEMSGVHQARPKGSGRYTKGSTSGGQ